MKTKKSVRPSSVYLVLSLEQIRAMAQLAEKQLTEVSRGESLFPHYTVSISADLCGPGHDNDAGAAQIASYSVAVEGANLNQFCYAAR